MNVQDNIPWQDIFDEDAEHGGQQFSDEFLNWLRNGVQGHSSKVLTLDDILLMRWAFDAALSIGYEQAVEHYSYRGW